jgi:ferritin-like metal-binding protein YciE
MALTVLEDKLHEYMADVHAMEKGVLRQLEALIAMTEDQEMRTLLTGHKAVTQQQIGRIEEQLREHGEDVSAMKDVGSQFAAALKAMGDLVRKDKPANIARDAYITEHVEIAAYELLERLALAAGDPKTAWMAKQNRTEEEAMANAVAANWDRALEQTLAEERVLSQAQGRFSRTRQGSGSTADTNPPPM